MEFTIKSGTPEKLKRDCIVVAVFSDGTLTAAAEKVDVASDGALSAILERGDLDSKAGSTLLVPMLPGVAAQRVLLVSLGKSEKLCDKAFRDAARSVGRALAALPGKDASVCLIDVDIPGRDADWRAQQAARRIAVAAYRFDAPRKDKKENDKGIRKIQFLVAGKANAALKTAVDRGLAIAEGMALTRDLGNLPANVCTPTYLANTAKALGKEFGFKVTVLNTAQMEKLKMGSLLSVAKGAHEPPRFITMEYNGGKPGDAPIVLVGKGITFDTGGISLKPSAEMDEMKYDMCGAASVFGTLKAIGKMALPINVIGVEVLNTDAEGRLILCDALTYVERFKPDCVIDIATLTGACVVALGKIPSGLLGNDDELARELIDQGQISGDRVWQLPLWDEYYDLLKSNFADMANIGGRFAGTITAAAFLSKFTKAYKWAHLDIAGTAWVSGEAKGATGRPVPLLAEFLISRATAKAKQPA